MKEEFRAKYLPMSWDAVTHKRQVWGYPVALEAASLIYNKKLVTGKVPTQLSELPAFGKELKAQDPHAIVIMWDYKTPYFSWPFLASAGGYPFKKTAEGYDVNDIGVANSGALEGLKAIVELINTGILPKGSTSSVMGEKMASGQLALMVSGPWDWANLRKAGVDFDLAPFPGVGGNPGRPFVGVFTALINRSSPNLDLAQHFLEEHVLTSDGLKAMDADAPLGVPALKTLCDEMAAKNHLIKVTYENAGKRGCDAEHSANGQILDFHEGSFRDRHERRSHARNCPKGRLEEHGKVALNRFNTRVIRLIGWVLILRGILSMFVPGDGIARMISWLKVEEFSWLYAILVLVIGAYLTWLNSRADLLDSAAYACTAMSPSIGRSCRQRQYR